MKAVALVVVLGLLIGGCGFSDPYEHKTPRKEAGAGEAAPPLRARLGDPTDVDPAVRAREARELRRTPAVQHLPYHRGEVLIDLGDVAPDGRLRLIVAYRGTPAAARAAYRGFLRRWDDSGRGYVVRYRQVPPVPALEEPAAAQRVSPEAVLRAVALLTGNWSTESVAAAYGRAVALSVGAARGQLGRAASQMRTGAARIGRSLRSRAVVTTIALRGSGTSRRAVVVIRQGIDGGDQPSGGYQFQVILAAVEHLPAGWAVSSWEPQP